MKNALKIFTPLFGLWFGIIGCQHQAQTQTASTSQPKAQDTQIPEIWGKEARYGLGYYLASLVPPENTLNVSESLGLSRAPYHPWDCRSMMTDFIDYHKAHTKKVIYSMHDSFILIRAFHNHEATERVAIKHFVLWHKDDTRFGDLPQDLLKGQCHLYRQVYIHASF